MLVGYILISVAVLSLSCIDTVSHGLGVRQQANYQYHPPSVSFEQAAPNYSINDQSYSQLTNAIPQILTNAVSISNHSWELGTLVEAILEVYHQDLTCFNYNPNATSDGESLPNNALNVVIAAMGNYSWAGSPGPSVTSTNLSSYLSSATSPVPLISQTLVDGEGALGDPNTLGPGAWVLAQFLQSSEAQQQLNVNGRSADDYAWAVGNQLLHLQQGNTSYNGKYMILLCFMLS